jgi:hypothetical protein
MNKQLQKADPRKGVEFISWMLDRIMSKKLVACFEGALEEAEALCLFECPIHDDDHFTAAKALWTAYRNATDIEGWFESLGRK